MKARGFHFLVEFNYGWLCKIWVCTFEFPYETLNDCFSHTGGKSKGETIMAELTGHEKGDSGAVQL